VEFQTINQYMPSHELARQPAAAGAAEEVVEETGHSQSSEDGDVGEKETGLGSLLSKFTSSKRPLPATPAQAAPTAKRPATAKAVSKQASGGGKPHIEAGQPAKAKAKANPGRSAKAPQLALAASVEFWPMSLIEEAVATWTQKSEDNNVAIRTGQGKKSHAEVAAGDVKFMLEVVSALHTKLADMSNMPVSTEEHLASFCREKCDTALFGGMLPFVVSCHSIGCCVFYFVCLGSSRCLQGIKYKFVPT
jgi:hypothetical protein